MVQSSSTTTSLMIPWRGGGVFSTRQLCPSPWGQHRHHHHGPCWPPPPSAAPEPSSPLTIALVHVLFNLFAVVLIYRVPFLRSCPSGPPRPARVGSENKLLLALGYVGGLFFALPALMMVAVK